MVSNKLLEYGISDLKIIYFQKASKLRGLATLYSQKKKKLMVISLFVKFMLMISYLGLLTKIFARKV